MSEIMQRPEPRYSYGDYVQWTGEERWELIDGVPYLMSPAPGSEHQFLAGRIYGQLFNQLENHPCRAAFSPFDVRLPEGDEADEDIQTVVQPDILVICDESKVDKKGIRGAPDFIIEIISPSTATRDEIMKAELYARHGVKEYWIVDPEKKQVSVHRLGEERTWREVRLFRGEGKLPVEAVDGLQIDLDKVFQ